MIELKCTQCGKLWYTANTQPGQLCQDCKGPLKETSKSQED